MADNPFLKRMNDKAIGDAGRKSEKRVAKSLGARLQPASGAMRGAKSDAVSTGAINCRYEMKSTTDQSIKVDIGWLSKISAEALSHNQMPVLVVSFVTPEGKPQMLSSEWAMVPLFYFKNLIDGE